MSSNKLTIGDKVKTPYGEGIIAKLSNKSSKIHIIKMIKRNGKGYQNTYLGVCEKNIKKLEENKILVNETE